LLGGSFEAIRRRLLESRSVQKAAKTEALPPPPPPPLVAEKK
jgi:hypothetical protein